MNYIQKNVLNDKRTDPIVYWNVLKNSLNNIKFSSACTNLISGQRITSIVEKTNIINECFAS